MSEAGVFILVIGLVIVLTQGALLIEEGKAYLERVYPEPGKARAVATLVVAPAFLLTLGALLLVATVGVDPADGLQVVLFRVGLIFLAAAGMHLGALVLLSRDRAEVEHIEDTEEHLHDSPR